MLESSTHWYDDTAGVYTQVSIVLPSTMANKHHSRIV